MGTACDHPFEAGRHDSQHLFPMGITLVLVCCHFQDSLLENEKASSAGQCCLQIKKQKVEGKSGRGEEKSGEKAFHLEMLGVRSPKLILLNSVIPPTEKARDLNYVYSLSRGQMLARQRHGIMSFLNKFSTTGSLWAPNSSLKTPKDKSNQ